MFIRFFINFILFGLLFYLISVFFPDTFHTLVSWVSSLYEFLKGIVLEVVQKFHGMKAPVPDGGTAAPKAMLMFLLMR